MTRVGVYEAKTNLPRLLNRVAKGARITIVRHGVPVAVLVPADDGRTRPLADVIADVSAFGKGRRLRGFSVRAAEAHGRLGAGSSWIARSPSPGTARTSGTDNLSPCCSRI